MIDLSGNKTRSATLPDSELSTSSVVGECHGFGGGAGFSLCAACSFSRMQADAR